MEKDIRGGMYNDGGGGGNNGREQGDEKENDVEVEEKEEQGPPVHNGMASPPPTTTQHLHGGDGGGDEGDDDYDNDEEESKDPSLASWQDRSYVMDEVSAGGSGGDGAAMTTTTGDYDDEESSNDPSLASWQDRFYTMDQISSIASFEEASCYDDRPGAFAINNRAVKILRPPRTSRARIGRDVTVRRPEGAFTMSSGGVRRNVVVADDRGGIPDAKPIHEEDDDTVKELSVIDEEYARRLRMLGVEVVEAWNVKTYRE